MASVIWVSAVALNTLLVSLPSPFSVTSLRVPTGLMPTANTSWELAAIFACVAEDVEYPVVSSPSVKMTKWEDTY